jgi:hypothetical protein
VDYPETRGDQLHRAVTDAYTLEHHELMLLHEAAETLDLIDRLQALVDRDGVIVNGKPHPALIEVRQQRTLLGRLLAALKIPAEDDRPGQYRGVRGFYGVRDVS